MLAPLSPDVLREINSLQFYDKEDLVKQYVLLFKKPPICRKPQILRSEIAFKLQENYYGGLDGGHAKELNETANNLGKNASQRRARPKGYLPGTRIVRIWHNKAYEVSVRSDGKFEYDGAIYRSLSAVATKITGTRWNGKLFFGIGK